MIGVSVKTVTSGISPLPSPAYRCACENAPVTVTNRKNCSLGRSLLGLPVHPDEHDGVRLPVVQEEQEGPVALENRLVVPHHSKVKDRGGGGRPRALLVDLDFRLVYALSERQFPLGAQQRKIGIALEQIPDTQRLKYLQRQDIYHTLVPQQARRIFTEKERERGGGGVVWPVRRADARSTYRGHLDGVLEAELGQVHLDRLLHQRAVLADEGLELLQRQLLQRVGDAVLAHERGQQYVHADVAPLVRQLEDVRVEVFGYVCRAMDKISPTKTTRC